MNPIYKRRSIRKFKNTSISKENLENFVKAGMNAPSACNQQPWEFMLLTEREILDKIPEDIHPYSGALKQAPAAILVCGTPDKETCKGYWVQDCAAATENILLGIASRNFGGVWLGIYPREQRVKDLRELLNIPENVVPFSIIAVGEPAEEKSEKNIFLKERIHYNKWDS